MNTAFILAIIVLGALSAALGAMLAAARREAGHLRADKTAAEQARLQAEADIRVQIETRLRTETELAALRASSQTEIAGLKQKNAEERAAEKAEREQLEERFRLQFKNLATEILGEQSQRFKETSRESIDILLKPFKENIVDFRKRVEEIYTTQTSQRGELKSELKRLMELNQTISTEARNLTDALKGNSKVQGDWGEMLLETILDSSALSKGIHYQTQYNIKDEEGRNLRPDVVLHLPEKKDIVIDSKVSLTAFVGYSSADTEEERRRYLAAHIASVRQHVTELGRKEYQRRLNSPDFVIMFIPNEPAFLAALQNDTAIWSDAYDKKVIISSPTNLFALLKLVADLWKYNDQDKNTKEIAACGLKLYEQLVAFTASLEGVGTALDKARDAYEDAHKRLCTGNDNIIRVGSAGALADDLNLMDVVAGAGACTDSNFAHQFGLNGTFAPIADYTLLSQAVAAAAANGVTLHVGNVLSADNFYDDGSDGPDQWKKMGVLAIEMEAAGLYMNAARAGKRALGLFTISDHIYRAEELTSEQRQNSFVQMITIALDTAVNMANL